MGVAGFLPGGAEEDPVLFDRRPVMAHLEERFGATAMLAAAAIHSAARCTSAACSGSVLTDGMRSNSFHWSRKRSACSFV